MTSVANDYIRPVTPPHEDSVLHQKSSRTGLSTQDTTPINSNDTTTMVSSHLQSLIYWERPARSMVTLLVSLSFIYLTRQYSLLEIGAAAMTISTGLNLAYVLLSMNTQRVFSDNNEPARHPHLQRLNTTDPLINKDHVNHYVELFTDIMEDIGKEVKKIVLIDDISRSVTWCLCSFVVWTFAAYISSRTLIVLSLLAAFTIPRLYRSNKQLVDARIGQANQMISGHVKRAQNLAYQSANDAYTKARSFAARTGTTGTDAKNTLNRASVVSKDD